MEGGACQRCCRRGGHLAVGARGCRRLEECPHFQTPSHPLDPSLLHLPPYILPPNKPPHVFLCGRDSNLHLRRQKQMQQRTANFKAGESNCLPCAPVLYKGSLTTHKLRMARSARC